MYVKRALKIKLKSSTYRVWSSKTLYMMYLKDTILKQRDKYTGFNDGRTHSEELNTFSKNNIDLTVFKMFNCYINQDLKKKK